MLRPRFYGPIHLTRGWRRFLFTLERPNKSRKVWVSLDLARGAFYVRRGFTLEVKVFE